MGGKTSGGSARLGLGNTEHRNCGGFGLLANVTKRPLTYDTAVPGAKFHVRRGEIWWNVLGSARILRLRINAVRSRPLEPPVVRFLLNPPNIIQFERCPVGPCQRSAFASDPELGLQRGYCSGAKTNQFHQCHWEVVSQASHTVGRELSFKYAHHLAPEGGPTARYRFNRKERPGLRDR